MPRRLAPLLFAFAVAACGDRGRAPAAHGLTDDFGDPVAAGAPAPRRIVSLSPATTELLFAMGAGPRLVGRSHFDRWPDSARQVPDLGPGLGPNVEAVLAAHPDLVVLYASGDDRAAARQLRAAGVRVVALRTDRIADLRRASRLLGVVTGDSARARVVVARLDGALARVRGATAPLPHPRVAWVVSLHPLITIGRGSYLNDLLGIAGATNVYADVAAPSPMIGLEDLVRRDPDVLLTGPENAAAIRASAAWRAVRAVRRDDVLVVDTMLVGRPSVQLGAAAASLANLLHPGLALPVTGP